MTYSNTNKDKTQLDRWRKLKQVFFYAVLGYIIYSSITNIYRQYSTLRSANRRLQLLEEKVEGVAREKRKFLKLVEEATGSATIARNQRQYFGVGTNRDYWIVMPTPAENDQLVSEVYEVETDPNLVKWWKLFTN
jgi:hypothetical protein